MSLPHATQTQIKEMERKAKEMMDAQGIISHDIVEQQPVKHPMLADLYDPLQQTTETEQPQVEEAIQEEVQEIKEPEVQETKDQKNYRQMRQELEQAKREREEALKYAMSLQNKSEPKQQQEPEDDVSDWDVYDEGIVEGKHGKKILKELRELKKEVNAYKKKTTEETIEIRLKTELPDFYQVISKENVQLFSDLNPDLADAISQTPDLYKRSKLAYDMIKKMGIYKDHSYDQEKLIAQKNAAKPRPLTSVSPTHSDSPLSKANAFATGELTKQVKEQMHREMVEAMKGR